MLSKLQQLPAEALYTALAVIGGVANYLSAYLRGASFDLRHFLAHAFVSGFSGLMFAQFAEFLGWAPQARSMAAGVGGFMGAKAVEYVADRLLARSSSTSKRRHGWPTALLPKAIPPASIAPGCVCGKCQTAARDRKEGDGFPIICLIGAIVFVVFLVWALASSARSQSGQCLPMEAGLQALRENAGEQPRYQATLANGREFLVTVAPSGSWSILALLPDDGLACMVAAGQQWRDASL